MRALAKLLDYELLDAFINVVAFVCSNNKEKELAKKVSEQFAQNLNALDTRFVFVDSENKAKEKYDLYVYFSTKDKMDDHSIIYDDNIINNIKSKLKYPDKRIYNLNDAIMLAYCYKYGYYVSKNVEAYKYLIKSISEKRVLELKRNAYNHFYDYKETVIKEDIAIYEQWLLNLYHITAFDSFDAHEMCLLTHFLFNVYKTKEALDVLDEYYYSMNNKDNNFISVALYYLRCLYRYDKQNVKKANDVLSSIKDLVKNPYDRISYLSYQGLYNILLGINNNELVDEIEKIEIDDGTYLTRDPMPLIPYFEYEYPDSYIERIHNIYARYDKFLFLASEYQDVAKLKDIYPNDYVSDYTYFGDAYYYFNEIIVFEMNVNFVIDVLPYLKDRSKHNEFFMWISDYASSSKNAKNLAALRNLFPHRYFELALKAARNNKEKAYKIALASEQYYGDLFLKDAKKVEIKDTFKKDELSLDYLLENADILYKQIKKDYQQLVDTGRTSLGSFDDYQAWNKLSACCLICSDYLEAIYQIDKELRLDELIDLYEMELRAHNQGQDTLCLDPRAAWIIERRSGLRVSKRLDKFLKDDLNS